MLLGDGRARGSGWNRSHVAALAIGLALAIPTAGCTPMGGTDDDPSSSAGIGASTVGGAPSTSAAPVTPVPVPAEPPLSATVACGAPAHAATGLWLTTPAGARIDASVVGTAADVVVLLHQTDRSACGFWPYAAWLDTQGVRSVLVNFCDYEQSVCPEGVDPIEDAPAAAAAAVIWARANGATRVTLVGASLGGTVAAVVAGSGQADVDAVVDLSGPVRFGALDAEAVAAKISVPALFAVSDKDTVVTTEQMKNLADAAEGTPSAYAEQPEQTGHGWQLLGTAPGFSTLAARIRAWAKGSYT